MVHAVHFALDKFLDPLTAATGGRTWSARSDRQLKELFGRVLDEVRASLSADVLTGGSPEVRLHQIKVSFKGARGDVIAKQGSFVR